MANHPRLEELLAVWQSGLAAGRDVPVAELCRSCPDLAAELEQRIAVLRGLSLTDTVIPPPAAALDTTAGDNLGQRAGWEPRGVGDRLGGFRLCSLLRGGG